MREFKIYCIVFFLKNPTNYITVYKNEKFKGKKKKILNKYLNRAKEPNEKFYSLKVMIVAVMIEFISIIKIKKRSLGYKKKPAII